MLRFVPYVGALIAAVLPTALAAAVDPGWSMVHLDGRRSSSSSEVVTGQVVEPLVYGHRPGCRPSPS